MSKDVIDLTDLLDFDVQIGVTEDQGIQMFEVTDIVTRWMNGVFFQCLQNGGWDNLMEYAQFEAIILLERLDRRMRFLQGRNRRRLQQIGAIYTAQFKGAALFTRNENQTRIPQSTVWDCQRIAFLEDELLLQDLQESNQNGWGAWVVDVQVFVVRATPTPTDAPRTEDPTVAPTLSQQPTQLPTNGHTLAPTDGPTVTSSSSPTKVPSVAPTTKGPTNLFPVDVPSFLPTLDTNANATSALPTISNAPTFSLPTSSPLSDMNSSGATTTRMGGCAETMFWAACLILALWNLYLFENSCTLKSVVTHSGNMRRIIMTALSILVAALLRLQLFNFVEAADL